MTLAPHTRKHVEDVICAMVEIMGDGDVGDWPMSSWQG